MAHDAGRMVPRLPLYPTGRQPGERSAWCFNMFVVWLLSGLWHGAGWNFALWGLYFGVFLSAEKLIGKNGKKDPLK